MKELLTNYGPVALIWFDTPRMMTGDRGAALRRHRAIAAAQHAHRRPARHRGRLSIAPATTSSRPRPRARRGKTPATINHTWGFRKDDTNWKSPGQIAFKLVDIVSKGGNYLLNVGPTAEGVIPQPSADMLRTVGRWLKVNGEAVYGAGPTPFGEEFGEQSVDAARKTCAARSSFLPHNEWRVTTKPGKLYLTFFDEPRAPFEIPAMKNRAHPRVSAGRQGAGRDENRERPHVVQHAERPMLDPMATVVVVEFEGAQIQK